MKRRKAEIELRIDRDHPVHSKVKHRESALHFARKIIWNNSDSSAAYATKTWGYKKCWRILRDSPDFSVVHAFSNNLNS